MYGARKNRRARWTKPKQQKIRQLRLRARGRKWKAIGMVGMGGTKAATAGTAVGGSGSEGAEAVGLGVGIVAPSGLWETLTQGRYSSVVIVAPRTPRTKPYRTWL